MTLSRELAFADCWHPRRELFKAQDQSGASLAAAYQITYYLRFLSRDDFCGCAQHDS